LKKKDPQQILLPEEPLTEKAEGDNAAIRKQKSDGEDS
jgi:hypothetical protein